MVCAKIRLKIGKCLELSKDSITRRMYFESDTQDLQNLLFEAYSRGFRRGAEQSGESRIQVNSAYWIQESEPDDNDNVQCQCSNCYHGDLHAIGAKVPYCWYCGAKMEEQDVEK